MPNILINVSEALLAEVDKVVEARKLAKLQLAQLTAEEKAEAVKIADAHGVSAANAWLRSKKPVLRASRVGVVLDLLAIAAPRINELLPAMPQPVKVSKSAPGKPRQQLQGKKPSKGA